MHTHAPITSVIIHMLDNWATQVRARLLGSRTCWTIDVDVMTQRNKQNCFVRQGHLESLLWEIWPLTASCHKAHGAYNNLMKFLDIYNNLVNKKKGLIDGVCCSTVIQRVYLLAAHTCMWCDFSMPCYLHHPHHLLHNLRAIWVNYGRSSSKILLNFGTKGV